MTTKMTTIRLDEDLMDWIDDRYGKRKRTHLIQTLLYALKEGRMRIVERSGPSAFPGDEEALPGQTPYYPAKVATCRRENNED